MSDKDRMGMHMKDTTTIRSFLGDEEYESGGGGVNLLSQLRPSLTRHEGNSIVNYEFRGRR